MGLTQIHFLFSVFIFAVEASPVAIGIVTAVHRLEHFGSSVSAIWTTHCASFLRPGDRLLIQRNELLG